MWIKVWDLPLRLFHWTLVAAIAVAFLSAEEGSALNEWHVLSGWIAAILLAFRLVWGFVGGEHSRFSDFIHPSRIPSHMAGIFHARGHPDLGHNPLGAVAVVILLGLTAGTVLTGVFGGEAAEELHEVIGWTLLAMIVIHILAVVVMSVIERENLARAMVTGNKPAERHPGAVDAKPPRFLGAVLSLAVIAGTAYAILQYDPHAFTLRSAEAYEHRANAATGHARSEREDDERDEHD